MPRRRGGGRGCPCRGEPLGLEDLRILVDTGRKVALAYPKRDGSFWLIVAERSRVTPRDLAGEHTGGQLDTWWNHLEQKGLKIKSCAVVPGRIDVVPADRAWQATHHYMRRVRNEAARGIR